MQWMQWMHVLCSGACPGPHQQLCLICAGSKSQHSKSDYIIHQLLPYLYMEPLSRLPRLTTPDAPEEGR